MKFIELWPLINFKTDVNVVLGCCIIAKIPHDTYYEDIDWDIRNSEIKSITAVDYRTIEVQIKGWLQ